MRSQILCLTSLLFFSTFPVVSQTTQEISEKPLYYATGNEVSLVGTISVKGKLPPNRRIDMTADPVCVKVNPVAYIDTILTNQNYLMNAFVYVKGDTLKGYRFEIPDSPVVLQQRNCRFEPHLFGLRVGQPLQIINADPTVHNVHPTPKLNQEWNYSQAPGGPPMVKTFARAEVLIPIKDNQHPWERAFVAVMDHPYFAISDKLGKFEIRGLPAGTYKLVVWHEEFGEQEIEVTLVPGEIRSADFTFDAGKTRQMNSSSEIKREP